jgi:hypothetical protein
MSDFARDQWPDLAGLFESIDPTDPATKLGGFDVQDDLEGEQETLPDMVDDAMQLSELLSTIGEASKGVSEATDADYRR